MWFKTILRREPEQRATSLFNEAFLRRMERLSLQVQQTLRGRPAIGEHLSRRQLPATIFSDHRPYSAGDDYRYVDWNAYAHQEQVFVKLGEIDQNIRVHVLLDVSRSMDWGEPSKLRSAQLLAGALGYLSLTHHDRLTLQPFGQSALPAFGPTHGKARAIELLRFISNLKADQPTALEQVLTNYAARHEQGGLLILCSDLLAPEGLERGLRALQPPRWQVLVLHIIDPRELQPPVSGSIELEDAETGRRLPLILDNDALAIYKQNVVAWREGIATTCARRGATYAQVLTNWPLERQLVPYLRARQILV